MTRLLAAIVVMLIANALAILATAWLLDDMTLDALALVTEVAIFTGGAMLLAEPLLRKVAFTHARALLGSTALLATLIALILTTVLGDGLTISGAGT